MFFVVSKTVGILIEPFYLAMCMVICAGMLRLFRRWARVRRVLLRAALAVLLLFSFGPTANLLLAPLEGHYTRLEQPEQPPAAIVLLGGMTSRVVFGSGYYELSGSADRLVEAVRLAHLYPDAKVLITGGDASLVVSHREGDMLVRLVRELGVSRGRMLLDRKARNTHENAVNAAKLLDGVTGPVLLVTSGTHMPRAVACFAKQGVDVVPWAVDFLRTGSGPGSWVPKPQTLLRSTVALHEYLGWLAYWVAGYV